MNIRCSTVPPAGKKKSPMAIRKVVEGWKKTHLFISSRPGIQWQWWQRQADVGLSPSVAACTFNSLLYFNIKQAYL